MFHKVSPNICKNPFLNCPIFFHRETSFSKGIGNIPGKEDPDTYSEPSRTSLAFRSQLLSQNKIKCSTGFWIGLWDIYFFMNKGLQIVKLLSANPTIWSNTIKQFVNGLFECVWPYCRVGAYMVNDKVIQLT